MSVQNHSEHFRPLRGGIVIVAASRLHYGTLGIVLTRTSSDRWGLTCAHVLGPVGGPVPNADPVFQPDTSSASFQVGVTDGVCADPALDCAAFRINVGVSATSELLGIGAPAPPTAAFVGMRLIKSGRSTGVTEGQVHSVVGSVVSIRLLTSFPAAYDLSEPGDSGSIWCEATTHAPVALHTSGTSGGLSAATAVDITSVLTALDLRPLH